MRRDFEIQRAMVIKQPAILSKHILLVPIYLLYYGSTSQYVRKLPDGRLHSRSAFFFVSIFRSVAINIYDNLPSYKCPLNHDSLMVTNTLKRPGAPSLFLQCTDRQVWSLLFQFSWLTSISAAATGGPNLMAAAETKGQRASWGENSSRRRTEMDGGHSGGSIRHS